MITHRIESCIGFNEADLVFVNFDICICLGHMDIGWGEVV